MVIGGINRLDKRGVSSVLTLAFIILGTIIGVVLLWVFVNKSIERGGETIDPDCLTLNLELSDCKAYGSCNNFLGVGKYDADVVVKRKTGTGNVTGLRFVFESLVGIKSIYDRDLNPPILSELGSVQFKDSYKIPVPGSPNVVKVVALIGEKRDVCPISSNSLKCVIVQEPPPQGFSSPSQCCQWLVDRNCTATTPLAGHRSFCCPSQP